MCNHIFEAKLGDKCHHRGGVGERVKGKLASALYLTAAIALFEKYGRENTIFVVATDDYKWSYNVFKGLRNVAFASNAPQQLRLCSYIL